MKTELIINYFRIKKRLHSSRKRRSLAFTVSWRTTRIACNSSFWGLQLSMMWWDIYFFIRRKTKKTKKTMCPNRSQRPTPWNCSNHRRTDHTWWRSRTLCDSISQFSTFLLGCHFGRHPRWLSNIVRRPRMPNLAASTTTWSVSLFTFSLSSPCRSSSMFSRIQRFGRFHWLLMQALIWVFPSSISGFACAWEACSTTFTLFSFHSLNDIPLKTTWSSSRFCSTLCLHLGAKKSFRLAWMERTPWLVDTLVLSHC